MSDHERSTSTTNFQEQWWSRLDRLRRNQSLSVAELAQRAQVRQATMYDYLSGKVTNPRGDVLQRLAQELGSNEQYLRFGGASDDPPIDWWDRLHQLMKERRINRKHLAQLTDLPYSTLARLLPGRTEHPRGDILERIANVLDVPVHYLRYGHLTTGEVSTAAPAQWWERLDEVMKEKEIKVPDLERETGISRKTLYGLLTGRTNNPRGDVLSRIADALSVPEYYLRYGRQPTDENTDALLSALLRIDSKLDSIGDRLDALEDRLSTLETRASSTEKILRRSQP